MNFTGKHNTIHNGFSFRVGICEMLVSVDFPLGSLVTRPLEHEHQDVKATVNAAKTILISWWYQSLNSVLPCDPHAPALFALVIFQIVSLAFSPGPASDLSPPTYTSCVPGASSVSPSCLAYLLR
jgi:hypothetical protein